MLTIHLISTFPPLLANLNSTFLTEYPHHPNCYWHHGRRICYRGVKPPHNANLVATDSNDKGESEDFSYDDSYDDKDAENTEDETVGSRDLKDEDESDNSEGFYYYFASSRK